MTQLELQKHIKKLGEYLEMYKSIDKDTRPGKTIAQANRDTKEYILDQCFQYVYSNENLQKIISEDLTSNPFLNGRIDDGIFTQRYFLSDFPKVFEKLNKIKVGYTELNDKTEVAFDIEKPYDIEVEEVSDDNSVVTRLYEAFYVEKIDDVSITGREKKEEISIVIVLEAVRKIKEHS
jgi:hypothetical protein